MHEQLLTIHHYFIYLICQGS